MERYVSQLIDDLHQVPSRMIHSPGSMKVAGTFTDLEDVSYVDEYLYGDRQPISVITQISKDQLPPVNKLTEDQQARLAVALENFLRNFHFQLDFPQEYPHHLRYPFIRNIWDDEHVYMKVGETHIEFCNYEDESCPFTGYCMVCDNVKEMESSLQHLNNDKNDHMEEIDLFENEEDSLYVEDLSDLHATNGKKIDLSAIPVPPLCTICRSNRADDWDEHLLCLMTRNDQRDKKDFKCGAFEID